MLCDDFYTPLNIYIVRDIVNIRRNYHISLSVLDRWNLLICVMIESKLSLYCFSVLNPVVR